MAAAEAVAGDAAIAAPEVLGLLEALVDKSLVKTVDGPAGEQRFTMLETLREYALDRLAARGEDQELQARHARHFVDLGAQAGPELHGPRARAWMDRLEADHDNLRAALEWSLATGNAEAGLRLAGAVWWFWELRGYRREGRAWLEALLALPRSGESGTARGAALYGATYLANNEADLARSSVGSEEGLALARQLGDERLEARFLLERSFFEYQRGDKAATRALLEQSLILSRGSGDEHWAAYVLWDMARYEPVPARAEQLNAESLAIARAHGDQHLTAAVLSESGFRALEEGAGEQAAQRIAESLALAQELGDLRTSAAAIYRMGQLAIAQGKFDEAAARFAESLELGRRINETFITGRSLTALGMTALWQGEPGSAVQVVAGDLDQLSRPQDQAWCEVVLGLAAEEQGRLEQAEAYFSASLARFREIGWAQGLAQALRGMGDLALRRGEHTGAAALLAESLTQYQKLSYHSGIVACLVSLASLIEGQGRLEQAARLWGAAEAHRAGERPEQWAFRPDDRARVVAARARLAGAAWAAGRELTLDAAADEALRLIEGSDAPPPK